MNAMKKIVTGVFSLTAAALQAATLQVGPTRAYTTIQAAVDAANNDGGDVIEVDEGTYTSDNATTYFIDIEKPVTVKAVGARDNTKIVCPKDYYGVKVNAEDAVLSGFTFETLSSKEVLRVSAGTVTNCAASTAFKPTVGKIVYVEKTGVIDDCTFKDVYINSANLGNGGVMYVMGGTIRNSLFDHVYADIGGGAGIAMRMDGEGLVSNCVFRSCSATGPNVGDGGCAALYVTKGTVADCRIYGNSVRGGCAGVYMSGGTMFDSLIYDNVATNCYSQTDGGAGLRMSSGTVRNCTITRNRTLYDPEGRGFSGVQMSNGTLTNCVVYGNIGGDLRKTGGKAVYCCFGQDVEGDGNLNADPRFANPAAKDFTLNATSPCVGAGGSGDDMGYQQLTEAQKTAPAIGAGIAVESEDAQVENCTVVINTANIRTGGVLTTVQPAVLRNLIVWGNVAPASAELNDPSAFSYSCSSALTPGVNRNLAADPLFRNPAKGDWRLRAKSPCVEAGCKSDWMRGASDLRGTPRLVGAPDMGAYEFPFGTVILVR